MVKASIAKIENDFYAAFIKAVNDIGEQPVVRGDHILIKPNLVEPASPESGKITDPRTIEAVARYCLDCGAARVTIGEGPSYFQPQARLRECFTHTGVSEVAERLGIEWVLFDEHKYRTFKGVSDCTPDEFRITEFAFACDKFIDLPVLKTHYLTTVTLAMKNLKGCLKREDKPLFHRRDLPRAVVELCKIIKPTLNVIDCTARPVVRQLTRSASEGKQLDGGLFVVSSDIVATDALGCALMGIDPAEVLTVTLGAAAGLGEDNLARIDIMGEELKRLKFKTKLPQEQLQQAFPLLEIIGADKACSGCLIPLLSSLLLLQKRGIKLRKPLMICLGRNSALPEQSERIVVGDCALAEGIDTQNQVPGCPPVREVLLNTLIRVMGK